MADDDADSGRPPLRVIDGEAQGEAAEDLAEVMNRTFSPDSGTGLAMRQAFGPGGQ